VVIIQELLQAECGEDLLLLGCSDRNVVQGLIVGSTLVGVGFASPFRRCLCVSG